MKALAARHWFLFTLAGLITIGIVFAAQLKPIADHMPHRIVTAAVLFVMSLPLDGSSMWAALRRPTAVLTATGVNFLVVPMAAWGTSRLLEGDLGLGLLIIASAPSTLASAAVWTRRAGGNDAVAILVTMLTSLICFLVTPGLLELMTGQEVQLDVLDMIVKLALVAVLPIFAAQLLRQKAAVAGWATRRKPALGMLGQCGILSLVLVGVIRAGLKLARPELQISLADWLLMIAAVIGVHLVGFVAGHLLARALGVSRPDRIAVGFSGSQKTLPIALEVANMPVYGGLTVLPVVTYHVAQLLVDTVLADRLKARTPESSPSDTA